MGKIRISEIARVPTLTAHPQAAYSRLNTVKIRLDDDVALSCPIFHCFVI